MVTFLTILHIIITISLIALVLVQDSKGGGMGVFGGGGNSSSVLGAAGATSLAAKLTKWFAIAFAITCIGLSMITGRSTKSVVDGMPVQAPTQMSPETAPPAESMAPGAEATQPPQEQPTK